MTVEDHKPTLSGDHPYRTNTKFMRNPDGSLARDSDGFLVPLLAPEDGRRERLPIRKNKEASKVRADVERKAIAKDKRRIKKRQSIGDPDCVQSRDEDFPLMAVLRRDGAVDAIRVVLAYRRLVAVCAADPLKGQSIGNTESSGLNVEYRSVLRDGVDEINAAHKEGYINGAPGGEIEYDGRMRKSKGVYDIPATRKTSGTVDGAPSLRTESLHIKVTEDVLIERIDGLPRLMRIRSALGPLVDPFEDAVLGGQTLQGIGCTAGFVGRDAVSAGKALVMQAIAEVERFLGAKKHTPANDNYLIERRKIA